MGPSRRSRIAHAQEFMTPISKLVLVAATPSRFGTTSKWSSAVRGSSAHLADCFRLWVRDRPLPAEDFSQSHYAGMTSPTRPSSCQRDFLVPRTDMVAVEFPVDIYVKDIDASNTAPETGNLQKSWLWRIGHSWALNSRPRNSCSKSLNSFSGWTSTVARWFGYWGTFPAPGIPFSLVYPSRRNLAPRTRLVMDLIWGAVSTNRGGACNHYGERRSPQRPR
jgi:hypothetical protein